MREAVFDEKFIFGVDSSNLGSDVNSKFELKVILISEPTSKSFISEKAHFEKDSVSPRLVFPKSQDIVLGV